MQLVRTVQIQSSPFLVECTRASKLLYNVALYTVRQHYFNNKKWLRYSDLWDQLKSHKTYLRLSTLCGSHPPQLVLRQVDKNFKSFFNAIKNWKKDKSNFTGRPKFPNYLRKGGLNMVYFTSQQCRYKEGCVFLTQKMHKKGFQPIKLHLPNLQGVRIIPFGDRFKIELIYKYIPQKLKLDSLHVLGIDLGLTNIVTATDNYGQTPFIIKGGIVKSINQFFNKKLAVCKSHAKKCNNLNLTSRIKRLYEFGIIKFKTFFTKLQDYSSSIVLLRILVLL